MELYRYFLELAYKGTAYKGWQIQHNAVSVQQKIQEALQILLKHNVKITGSGRTDAGVHALQQFAHFDTIHELRPQRFLHQLNAILPSDIVAKKLYSAQPQAHARFDALWRKYEYRIYQQKNPFLEGVAYFFKPALDVQQMNLACQILLQHTDFQAFSLVNTDIKNFNCQLLEAQWTTRNDMLIFHIKADRFLRGMVRAIVGTLLWVGTGKIGLETFEQIILSKNRSKAGEAVVPHGLFLVEIAYPANLIQAIS
ncbi:MAG: tRNA pseudouridine(38-40) synthase TruA [Microscillaceae bacterium]|nr:tRNA pseudouridine(38-40) synthase TruA [Microscillaceae bacterium]MDW8460898.1 tRNA pseudouridine(38-40) synthase TruA [Cytophagales bacterium]